MLLLVSLSVFVFVFVLILLLSGLLLFVLAGLLFYWSLDEVGRLLKQSLPQKLQLATDEMQFSDGDDSEDNCLDDILLARS